MHAGIGAGQAQKSAKCKRGYGFLRNPLIFLVGRAGKRVGGSLPNRLINVL
ncbi:hypothetical protein BAC3_02457 [uncultured bacterium]|nr:hypothetical protein BAC3_02457 [uncultured bacterium]